MAINMNGACLSRIRAGIQHGSEIIVRIGRAVLKAPMRARTMSIKALAEASGTSPATVFRFCRDLGYSGYKEFQLDLAAAVVQNDELNLEDFVEDASPRTIARNVFEYNRQSLAETARMLDYRVLTRVARLIQRSRRVIFLGLGSSGLAARVAAQRLQSLGFTAMPVVDPYTQIFVTENLGREDVVIGISHTGKTMHIIEAIRAAQRRGARTAVLTNYPQSPLARASRLRLITAFREHRINAAISSSIIAQLCVIHSLYFILGSWGGREARNLADEAEQRARRLLRPPISKRKAAVV